MNRAFLLPALLLTAMNAEAQTLPTPSLITASGTAESKTAPDMATIRIGVETQAKSAKEAQAGTNALAQRLIAAAMKVVPDKKAFQTSDLSLRPEYTQSGRSGQNDPPKIAGYVARNVLTVRIDDVTKVGPLVDAVTDAGATNVDSISFGLKDEKPARRAALMDAVQDARDKAEAMAAGLGLKLAGIQSIEEGGASFRPYAMPMMAMSREAKTPVMPGEVSLSASVTVRFFFTQTSPAVDGSRGR